MPSYLHPGVYVREVPSGARPLEGVPTSVTIFVGETERGPLEPTRINGIADYVRNFGGHLRDDDTAVSASARVTMRYAVDAFFRNGGASGYVLRAVDPDAAATTLASRTIGAHTLQASSPGAWGRRLRVVVLASSDGDTDRFRLAVFYEQLHPAGEDRLVEVWDRLSLAANDPEHVVDVLRGSQYVRWVMGAPPPPDVPTFEFDLDVDGPGYRRPNQITSAQLRAIGADSTQLSTGGLGGNTAFPVGDIADLLDGLNGVDDASLLVGAPGFWLDPTSPVTDPPAHFNALQTYVSNRPKLDLFYVADLPRYGAGLSVTDAADEVATEVRDGDFGNSDMVGAYWPHVRAFDPVGAGRNPELLLPPSGFVAGLYARTDARRGVWKAPAGVEAVVGGITGLQHEVLDVHQDQLNPLGINALRVIPNAGAVVWGSRTRRPTSEWRYIPVRRNAIFLRGSIYNGIQWAVFEPNDEPLWQALRVQISAFMETQFRNGAFAGATSREAYFVKVDSQTTTPDDQANGIVNILVGFSPLRPAEFVVLSLTQKTAESAA